MARFGAAVAGDAGGQRLGGDGAGHQGGGAGADAVEEHRRPQRGAAEDQTDEGGVFEAADGGEDADGVGRVGLVEFEGAADDIDLAGVRLVVDARAAAGDLGRVGAGVDGDQGGRGGGVGDAHLAREQRLVAGRDEVPGGFDADLYGLEDVFLGHRRALGEVGGAGAYLARQQARGGGEVAGHADVHDAHLGADLVGEGVADRAAAQEVGDHLAGDLLGPGGHALGVHAVVAREDRDGGGLRDRRRALAGQSAQLRGDDLQHAQRPGGLGHPLLPLPRLAERLGVQRADALEGLLEEVVRVLAGQGAAPVGLLVDDPGQRAALGPAGLEQLGLLGELVDVADAQVGDDFEVLGQAQFADHLALVEEADPADAQALGAGGEPEVLDGQRGGVRGCV